MPGRKNLNMLGFIKKQRAAELLAPFLKALQQQIVFNQIRQTTGPLIYGFGDADAQINAYATMDDLYSIVSKLDDMCKSVCLYAYEVKDEKAYAKYSVMSRKVRISKNYTNKNISDLQELQYKSVELLGDNDPLQKILERPNEYESKDEFYSGLYIFPFLTGNCYTVINTIPEGPLNGANQGKPFELYHLAPNFVNIQPSATEPPRYVVRYDYALYGTGRSYTPEQVMHRKFFNPGWDWSGSELYGLSPLSAARRTLEQIGNERDYANRSLINAGAEGVLVATEANDLTVEALGKMKDDTLRELGSNWSGAFPTGGFRTSNRFNGGSNVNAKKLGFLEGKWDYLRLTISPADMMLVEQGKMTFKKLCNVYGISDRLFNNDATGSEISIDKMLRDGFISVAIPQVAAVKDMFNLELVPLYNTNPKARKKIVDYDISDVTQLQEDQNLVISRFADAPGYKPNDLREAQGYGRDLGDLGEVFLVKQGYMPLEDAAMPVDLTPVKNGLNPYE